MTITASGPGAAWLAPQARQDGTWALALTAIPTVRAVSITLHDEISGESETFTLTYEGISSDAPIERDIVAVADRTFAFKRVPDKTSLAGVATAYAVAAKQPFDGRDASNYQLRFADFLSAGETFGTLVAIDPSAAAGTAGIVIDTDERRPAIDHSAGLVEVHFKCSTPGSVLFSGEGTNIGFEIVFTTAGGLASTFRKTIALLARKS